MCGKTSNCPSISGQTKEPRTISGDTKTLIHTLYTALTEPINPSICVGFSLTLYSVFKLKMDSAWSSFTPEVTKERVGMSYRFKFPGSGLFHCSFTGLVFNVTHEGEVTYKCLIWDDMLLQPANKVPGGPLFRISCPQESISKLYLPHCEPEPALVAESLSVVHITDDGMSVIQPLEITETHVVVDIPHLSAFGIVWDIIKRFKNFLTKPINGRILVFLRPRFRGIVIINFILLASNVPVNEVKAQHDDSEFIEAPSLCHLHKFQNYSVHSDPRGLSYTA
ncbi:NACHT, LRR and PYD domains-containing protein 1a isoform X2 [Lates calcarifer]|uniref:NACHT, LRR and PYD domains-containing protein 1a isoform X2 n=1 Tax=Lates calcarifer TaxID=8187 RepID=A0AAJ8DMI2_LATCA|nr:NACHT, LRR and PYD domains-containing protein 1a isoform X2 [Lates calcarifer]